MTATMADQAILDGEPAAGGLARQHGAPEDWASQELGTGAFVPEDVHRRRWAILAVLCLSLVLIVMDNTILNVALPSLVNDLGATNSQLQWIVDSYVLVFAGLLLTAGALGDRFGRKGALTVGLVDLRPRLGGVDAGRLVLGPHRDPGDHGPRRRLHHAGDALDPHQRVPRSQGAGPRHRHLGRVRRPRRRHRTGGRRPAARALLVALGLPHQRAA